MVWLASIRIALRALASNKLRTALTTLGIVIGVGAVIAMLALAQGAASRIRDQFTSLGTNLLTIRAGSPNVRPWLTGFEGPQPTLVSEDAVALRQRLSDSVSAVAEVSRGAARMKMGNRTYDTAVVGVSPEYEQVALFPVEAGRFISEQDVAARSRVAVIGRTIVQELTGSRTANAVGQTMQIQRTSFRIVGITAEKGAGAFGQDQDDIVLIPVSTALRRVFNRTYLNEIDVSCKDASDMDVVAERVAWLLRSLHKLRPPFPDNDDFTVRSQAQLLEVSATAERVLTGLLGGIALVSLLVGGIGIMNIMLVSVTERTREIGIRKAVGATSRHILVQFLIESVVIAVSGGLLGILLGVSGSALMAWRLNFPVSVSPHAIVLAVIVAATVGIFFGIWPARKAARLHPIEALRYE